VRVPDYTFYVEDYLGEDIPEKEFPRFIRRAGDELRRIVERKMQNQTETEES